jgi:hypothetical protein
MCIEYLTHCQKCNESNKNSRTEKSSLPNGKVKIISREERRYICRLQTLPRNRLLNKGGFSLKCVSSVEEGIQYQLIDVENVEEVSLDLRIDLSEQRSRILLHDP